MKKLFALEVTESNISGLLPGDEVIVDGNEMPKGNGQDLGVFLVNGEHYISRFTRFGNQIMMLLEDGPIQVMRLANIEILGKVIGGSMEMDVKKAPAVTGAHDTISLYA